MAVPTLSLVEPIIRVPYVAEDAITVAVDYVSRPAPVSAALRVYPTGSPGNWHTKALVAAEPEDRIYFTWDRLVAGTEYVIEAVVTNEEGAGAIATTSLIWNPQANLFPPPSPLYSTGPRPWSWEAYRDNWLNLLAWYYREDPLTLGFLERMGQEFQRLASAVEQIERFVLPSRAYETGLELWERALGIRPPETLAEPRRRAMVMAHLQARVDASASLFAFSLLNILGRDPKISENFNAFEVTVNTEGSPEVQQLVEEVVERILPAHLLINFNPSDFRFDYSERRAAVFGIWPRGRATNRPAGVRIGGFDSGGMS